MPSVQQAAMSEVPPVSEHEIEELAERYGLKVNDATVADLTDQVSARLAAGLEEIYEFPLNRGVEDFGDRSWREPGKNPYNAISIDCSIPPMENSSDLLAGVKVGVKDNIAVAGVPMQCGSAVMRGHIPEMDAALISRLRAAGAEITAKTNLDEFAVGGRSQSFKGKIINPRDETRETGGSSGGSAAAVAAGDIDVAIGTDTGGSVRMPAAFCGIVGLKPTYGLVPISGIVENTYTLDHAGPLANSVYDAARVLEAIAGKDEQDPASMVAAGSDDYYIGEYIASATNLANASDLRFAVLSGERDEPKAEPVESRHDTALERLSEAGVTIKTVQFDELETVVQAKNATSYCELAAHWRDGSVPYRRNGAVDGDAHLGLASRLKESASEMNDFHRSRILAGATLIHRYNGRQYTRAREVSRAIREEIASTMEGYDAIVTPTVPHLAPKLEQNQDPDAIHDKNSLGTGRYTKIANITGLPAITVPNKCQDGLPVGFQLIGSQFQEASLLSAAARTERLLKDDT